jgi:uncharacterized protein with von Willebrand factor type A (vWA) domain
MYIVDVSGSMTGDYIERAKRWLAAARGMCEWETYTR